jgi:hypothetical protein
LTELQSELTFIRFLRAGILLAALIVVPATAICWNMIPKDFFGNDHYDQATSLYDQTTCLSPTLEKPENLHSDYEPVPELPETSSPTPLIHPIPSISSTHLIPSTSPSFSSSPNFLSKPYAPKSHKYEYELKPQEMISEQNAAIKTMGGIDEKTFEQSIPNSFNNKSAIVLVAESSEPVRKVNYSADYRTPAVVPQQSFPVLENQLKQLGAKYYRLEKWGSRGELFRFSCYVSPSEPYQYQKYFQAIDTDELKVMESVIEEIKRWKK